MAGVFGNRRTIGIQQREIEFIGEEDHGGNGADVEAANVSITAEVEALERRGHQAAVAADERTLDAITEYVAAFT